MKNQMLLVESAGNSIQRTTQQLEQHHYRYRLLPVNADKLLNNTFSLANPHLVTYRSTAYGVQFIGCPSLQSNVGSIACR